MYKQKGIRFSVQRRFIANNLLFSYSKCIAADQWYIARLSSFGLMSIMVYVFFLSIFVSFRIRKKETFRFSSFNPTSIMVYVFCLMPFHSE